MAPDLSLVSRPPAATLTLRGELDLSTSPELAARVRAAMATGCRYVQVDLTEVTFLDASTLGVLTTLRRELREVDGRLEFVGYPRLFLRLCRATGLADHFGLESRTDGDS